MFFTIKSTSADTDLAIYRAKRYARTKLALHSLGTTELLINRFLQEKYNISLKAACLKILLNMKFNLNLEGYIIATIPDEELNKLAKLITYGNGIIIGSRLLRDILTID